MFTIFDKAITNTVILRQYPTFMYWNIKSVQSRESKKRRERQREREIEKREIGTWEKEQVEIRVM